MRNDSPSPKKSLAARVGRGVVSIIAILLLIVVVLYFSCDLIVGKILTSKLGDYCGTEAKIGELCSIPDEGRVEIADISVANPAGFSAQPLFSASAMVIDIAPSSLWKREKVIDELCIDGFTLFYERHAGGRNNLSTLVDRFSQKGEPGQNADEPLYRIKTFRLTNPKAILLINGRINVVKIDDIELQNIGCERALTKDELIEYVVTHFSGKFDSANFVVRNPEGYTEKDFIRVGDFHVELDMSGVPQRRYRVKQVTTNAFFLNLETLATGRNNMQELGASLMQDQQKAQTRRTSATVEVDEFLIGNVNLILSNDGISKRISLGKFELKEIGKQQPMTAEEVSIYILMQLNDFVNRSGDKVAKVLNELMRESAKPKPGK